MSCTPDILDDLALNADTIKKEEYDTQFLGFTPKSLSDGLYNIVITYAWDFFEGTHKEIQRISKSDVTEEDFNRASDLILGKMTKKTDEAFDSLESYLVKHILHVPDNVILPDDEQQEKHPEVEEEIKAVRDQIQQLKQGIKQAKVYNRYLQKELLELKAVNSEVTQCSHQINQLKETSKKSGALDLKEWTSFTVTEMQKLIQTMQDQPLLPLPEKSEEDQLMEVAKTIS